jgi:hypothetical protein
MSSSRTKVLFSILAVVVFAAFTGCTSDDSVPAGKASSPTESYKMLYTAVKAKNPGDIKKMLSKDTVRFAEGVSAQAKKSFDEQIKNGFTRTTFADKMPAIRDERINGNFGAVEVYNAGDNKWEDLPFILEDGGWKLAVGNVFAGSWQRPGLPRSIREQQNANAAGANKVVPYGNLNSNVNTDTVNRTPIIPKPMPMPKAPSSNKAP